MKLPSWWFMPLLAVLTACSSTQSIRNGDPSSAALNAFFEDYFQESLRLDPLAATFIGDHRYDDRLPNKLAPAYRARVSALEHRSLERALKFDPQRLSERDRLSWELFVSERRTEIAAEEFPDYLLPMDQLASLAATLPILGTGTSAQPFKSVADYERFLARIKAYLAWSDQAIINMREGMRRNVVQPRVVMAAVLDQLAALITTDPETSVFYAPIRNMSDDVPVAARARLAAAYRRAITEQLNPSYRRLHDFIRDEYLPQTRSTVAWSELPDGAKWYAFRAKTYTTTDMTPDQIHELGLQEVARIRAEMEDVRKHAGFQGDLRAFFKYMQEDERFYFTDAQSLLQSYRELKTNIDARLPQLFSDFPKADYEIRAVEAFRAEAAPGAEYEAPSADGSRPGIFYINTFNLKAQPKFGMETLSLHEAAPGHHFQISIQQGLQDLPKFRRFGGNYVAYLEGWALYAEALGKELGLFTDPYQYYGRLSDEMLRAMRLVVDTGLHTRGWTREQAIAYMLDNSSMAPSDVKAEVERYIADPGQALGYKIGQIRIRELRNQAQAALGSRFDIKEFHREVLRDGALPMDILEQKMARWLVRQQGR